MRRRTGNSGRWTQQGGMLVETAVAILIFSMVGTAVLSGLSTGAISSRAIEEQSTMENIARNQMEYVLSEGYVEHGLPCPVKPTLEVLPTGYSMTCEADEYDQEPGNLDIASVVVTVDHGGSSLVLETVRARP